MNQTLIVRPVQIEDALDLQVNCFSRNTANQISPRLAIIEHPQ